MASANNALIGALRVEASLDAGKFVDGASKIQKTSKQTEAAVKSSFAGMGTAIKGQLPAIKAGIAAFVGTLTFASLVAAGKSALEYAGHLGELAETLGVTTKDLQVFSYAAGQVGVSQEALQTSLQKLTITLGQMKAGAEAPRKALDALKQGLAEQVVAAPDTGAAFKLIASAMEGVTDRTQRAAVEVALFKKSGAGIDNLLSGAEGGLNEFADAAERLGIVLSDEQIKNADKTADKLDALKTVLSAQISGVIADNASAIYQLADSLIHLVAQISPAIRQLKSFYASFLTVRASVAEKVDQSIMSPINRFNPLVGPLRALHDQRAAAIAADRKEAGDIRRGMLGDLIASTVTGHGAAIPAGRQVGHFLAPTPQKAEKKPADRSDELAAQFAQDQLRADQAILQAKQQLAGTSEQRFAISLQLIEIDRQLADASIAEQVSRAKRDLADGKITKAAYDETVVQSAILQSKNNQKAELDKQALIEAQMTRQEQAVFDATDQRYKFALDALHVADQLATTQADHRRIQLQILDSEIEQKRLELEHEKDLAKRNGATVQEIANIQAKIDNLPAERAQGAAGINQNTRSPLDQWKDEVPKTAAEINEALQSIETKGLDGLSDAITGIITGTESLKGAFHQLALSILQDLIQMTIKMLIFKAISGIAGAVAGGSAGGGGGGTEVTGGTDAFFASNPIGFASGGSFVIGGASGTDRNVLALNGLPIAKVSYGESVNIGKSGMSMDGGGQPVSVTMHNDFRGADPSAVAAIQQRLDRMQSELPATIVTTMSDARDRFLWRGR